MVFYRPQAYQIANALADLPSQPANFHIQHHNLLHVSPSAFQQANFSRFTL